ncbi:MAG: YHS domain-containing protein [Acidobacteriota bacterium]
MKRPQWVLLSVFWFVSLALTGFALAADPAGGNPQVACPVSGRAVDKAQHLDWQGQRIYFCCGACPGKFTADPEAYFSKFAADGVVLENVQGVCPVSGEALEERGSFVDFKGRRVFFCCDKCIKEFEKDPAKYLARLPGEQGGK